MASSRNLPEIWAKILGRAWADKEFKAQLILHPNKILKENGFPVAPGEKITIFEDTPDLKHIIIHTSDTFFKTAPDKQEQWKRLTDSEKVKIWGHFDSKELKLWEKLVKEVKTNPKVMEEILTRPHETLKRFGIPENKSRRLFVETEKDKYLVIPRPPKGALSEDELEWATGGTTVCCSDGYCTDGCTS